MNDVTFCIFSFQNFIFQTETFPNATNPMKIIPSPSLPSLKVQRLNVLNKLSTLKGSCIGLNAKDDADQTNQEQSGMQRSDLERRTVDTKHISTVSSLVATKTDSDDGQSTNGKESQRNNFGLYALKFHRNLATHANSMLMNFKRDSCVRSKASKSIDTSPANSPTQNKTLSNRSKHEYFEPCDRAHTNYNDANGHYDDEFDEGCSVDIWNKTNRFQRNRQQFKMESESVVSELNTTQRAPVRPRRVKPIAPKANSITAHDANIPKNSFNSANHQFMPYESVQSMDNFRSDQNVMNI